MMWFKQKVDWEREYDIVYEYSQRLEKQLEASLEMNKKLVKMLEENNGDN